MASAIPVDETMHPERSGDAAREEIPELLLHELRQTVTIGVLRRRVQERLQMLADHAVQHSVLGDAG